jgi:hypothetical protein
MLRLYLIAVAFTLPFAAFAQEVDVPYKVKIQFTDDFISASNVKWDKSEQDQFTVDFFHQSQCKKATYSKDGVLFTLKTQLTSLVQVPQPVSNKILKRYASYSVDQIWKSELTDNITFHFVISKGKKIFALAFLPSGKLKHKIKKVDLK